MLSQQRKSQGDPTKPTGEVRTDAIFCPIFVRAISETSKQKHEEFCEPHDLELIDSENSMTGFWP